MAIGRLSMKVGKAGKAGPHAAYIAREGQYADRLERGEKLEATEAGNMPAWAQSNPQAFWQAADAFERKNGTTYREMEIALPRELDANQRAALVRELVRQEIGDRHAYQWAIHTPTAADGQEQPHLHLMFSERQRDGIERDPEQYFKRYNAKTPENGGTRKGYGQNAGQTLTKAERVSELKALRDRWQTLCNTHLARAGVEQRIDMRSHAERGTGLEPERKQLPSQWRGQGRANVIEFRQARAELAEARQELARAVPDARAEVIHLEAERQRREQAQRQARDPLAGFRASVERAAAVGSSLDLDVAKANLAVAQEYQAAGKDPRHHLAAIMQEGQQRAFDAIREQLASEQPKRQSAEKEQQQERQRLERMSSRELAQEIARLRPPPVRDLVERDPAVIEAERQRRALEEQHQDAQVREAMARHEAEQWRQAHPLRAKAHDIGLLRSSYLEERAKREAEARREWLAVEPRLEDAALRVRQARSEAEARITAEQAPIRAKVAELEAMQQDLARAELAEKRAEREREAVPKDFELMAQKRELRSFGWSDRGKQWLAAPQPLRDLIEDFNATPPEQREAVLQRIMSDPTTREHVRELMAQQREKSRGQGLSR